MGLGVVERYIVTELDLPHTFTRQLLGFGLGVCCFDTALKDFAWRRSCCLLSFLSQSVHVSSSIQLPERCIGTAGVVISGLAGYMLDGSETEGLVVLPSSALLGECVEKGELPEDVYRAVTDGDQHAMGLLSEEQRCLAAGFTHIQCNKLGGKKPSVAIVPPAEGPYMPVPRLDVSLDVLN